MSLRQIKIDFRPEQDRLLMLASNAEGAEFRMWLTRRYVKLLWPQLLTLAASSNPRVQEQGNPEARKALMGMAREQALSKADFSRPYESAPKVTPLGAEPILLVRLQAGRDPQGRSVLGLHPLEGQGITLTLDNVLLHALCKLIQVAVEKSDWQLDLRFPGAEAAPEPPPSGPLN